MFLKKTGKSEKHSSILGATKASLEPVSANLTENISRIRSELGYSIDLAIRELSLKQKDELRFAIIYISGLADKARLNSLSLELENITEASSDSRVKEPAPFFKHLKSSLLGGCTVQQESDSGALFDHLLTGTTILMVDGVKEFLVLNTIGPEGRSIEEPTSQTVIRGSKEAFTEKISVNISQIRRRLKSKDLRVQSIVMGELTKTSIAMVYLEGTASERVVAEIQDRLGRIRMDGILESGYIEELIKDDPYSIFPTFLNLEKPDSVAAGLLEGRVAILVDGTPYVLTAPAFFTEFFQVSEDYYNNYAISSLLRFMRFCAFLLAALVPAFFIALITFHQEMIPTSLLISITAQREGKPFPVFIEALLMEVTFEILREAGVRMPRAVGMAISIVGALVLGQAAVEAGIISAVMVIIVSITAISSFVIPNYSMINVVRIIKFIFMFLAALLGLYGIFMGLIVMVLHLCKIKTIGIPYMMPIAPKIKGGNTDTFIRPPIWKMRIHRNTAEGVKLSGTENKKS